MIVGVDTNILVFAFRADLPEHQTARALIHRLATGKGLWAIAWPSLYEFYRLTSHPKVFKKPSSLKEIISFFNALQNISSLTLLSHGPAHLERLSDLAVKGDAKGNLAFDVQIAAIFLEHGVEEIITNDGDFRRFGDLVVRNPFTS